MLPSAARAIEEQRRVVDGNLLGVGDAAKLIGDLPARDRLELEDLRARQHGLRNLRELGRRHHEDDVRRRLFDRFQQRVERVVRELMDFVDDEDLVAVPHRHDRQAR